MRLSTPILWLVCLAACAPLERARQPLEIEPWRVTRRGTFAPFVGLGVASDFQVHSEGAFQDANFDAGFDLDGELVGRFGGALGAEWFALDDLSLFAGLEYRLFDARLDPADTGVDPESSEPLLAFGTIDQFEWFAGSRWYLPVRWGREGRLRPYLLGKLAWVPSVSFEAKLIQPLGEFESVRLVTPFSGGPYTTLGLGGGLAWQASEHVLWRLGAWYEWALSNPSDVSRVRRLNSSGNDFLDAIFDDLELELEIEPRGPIAYTALSFAF